MSAAASPPVGSPPQYSPALRWVTTGFGMGPGGASTLSATGTPHPPTGEPGPLAACCASATEIASLGDSPPGRRPSGRPPHAPVRVPARPAQPHTRLTGIPGSLVSGPSWGAGQRRETPSRWRGPPRGRVTTPDGKHTQDLRPRPLGRLGSSRLPAVHLPPINPVICRGSYLVMSGDARLGEGFPLRCFQRFARPHVATQRCRSRDNWHTSGASTPVLSY